MIGFKTRLSSLLRPDDTSDNFLIDNDSTVRSSGYHLPRMVFLHTCRLRHWHFSNVLSIISGTTDQVP